MSAEMLPMTSLQSVLYVPAHLNKFIEKAATRGADAVLLDLEDGVGPAEKDEARANVKPSVDLLSSQGAVVFVRPNREMRVCVRDLEGSLFPGVSAIVLPKVEDAAYCQIVDEVMSDLEAERGLPLGGIDVIAMIETAKGVLATEQIAAAPRVAGLSLGSEDLSLDLGVEPTPQNLRWSCENIVCAARAAKIAAFGFPGSISALADQAGFESAVREGRSMGFTGAFCVHPKQIETVKAVYAPSKEELERAAGIVKAFEEGLSKGVGAVAFDGLMIDKPVADRARAFLAAHTKK